MADPRDQRDETLDDDPNQAGPGGGTLDDSAEAGSDTGRGSSHDSSLESGEVDFERMRRVWGIAADPDVSNGMTIKVDEGPAEESGTVDGSAEEEFALDGGTLSDEPDSKVGTVADDDVPSGSAHATLADESIPAGGTITDDDVPIGATVSDVDVTESHENDRTFVVDEHDPDSVPPVGATLADGEASGGGDDENDRTFVMDEDDPGPSGAPMPTLGDDGAEGHSDENDQTFVMDEPGAGDADRTFVLDDADESAESGSFAEPDTLHAEGDIDATMMGDDPAGPGGGPPDTWQPRDQDRTFVSGADDSVDFVVAEGLGKDVGITVRPRSFASGDADPDFGADYEILKQLGQGGMGVVFQARQASIDREVAVKMLKPPKSGKKVTPKKLANQRTKFLAEAVVTGDLDHPNIVPVYDLGTDESGSVFYSMKCVRGTPWDEVIGEKSLAENLSIFERVADAVAFAHSRGVVHRDLKPENVMLGDFGEVLLMDWGLALTNDTFTKAGKATKTGSIGGTPSYMAPEMAAGDITKVGTHSDVYLLGAILYEIVAGHPPHSGADVMKCLYNAAKNVIVPTDRTGELVDIAMKAMSTKRRRRYESVQALQDAIREYQSHSESIAMSHRAAEDLVEARKSDSYEDYAKAMYGFEESLDLWSGNERAARGVSEARLAYATSAMEKGDLDLASTLLRDDDPTHDETRTAIVAAHEEREARQRRFTLLKRVSVAAACLLFVVISGAAIWINAERNEAITQREEADRQRDEADRQREEADHQRDEADKQRGLAVAARDDAITAQKEAERAAEAEKEAKVEALAAKQRAEDAADAEKKAKDAALLAQRQAEEAAMAEAIAKQQALAQRDRANAAAFDSWISQKLAEIAKEREAEAKEEAVAAERSAVVARDEAVDAKEEAEVAREEARRSELDARFAGFEAETRKEEAQYASAVAELERLAADVAREQEAVAKEAALVAKKRAEEAAESERKAKELEVIAKREAILAKEEAERAKEAEEYEAYVAQIGLAAAKIRENAFDSARELLVQCTPKHRNWEWGRLMHLCSQSSRDLGAGGPVESVALSPDGQLLAVATRSGEVVLWERETGRERLRITEGGLYVNAVAFSPDGNLLATGGMDEDDYVKLWDTRTGDRVDARFNGHDEPVLSVAFDADGKRLLTSSYDETARIWDLEGNSLVELKGGHSWWIWSAAFLVDPENENRAPADRTPERVVTASHDGTVGIWTIAPDPETGVLVANMNATFTGHDGPVFHAAVAADGKRIVSGGYDGRLLVWNPADVKEFDFRALADGATPVPPKFLALSGHRAPIRSIRFGTGDSGNLVVTGGDDNTVRVWNLANAEGEELVNVFRGHDGSVRSADFSSDGRSIVSGSLDETAKVWTIADYEEFRVLRGRVLDGHSSDVLAADFSRDGNQVVTASRDRTARTYDARSGELQHVLTEGHSFLASSSVFLADKVHLATAAADNTTRLWDTRTGTQVGRLEDTGRAAAIATDPNGKFLLTGGGPADTTKRNWVARVWNAKTREPLHVLEGHASEVTAVAVSADGTTLYTGTVRGTGRLWDAASGKLLHTLSGHTERINAALFLPDGSRVVTASGDYLVAQWDTETGRELPALALKHGSGVRAMALAPDGRTLVTAADDFRIRIWNVDENEPVGTLGGAYGVVSGVDVSPDGTKVVSTHTGQKANGLPLNVVKVWNLADRTEIPVVTDQGERSFLDWSNRSTPIWSARFSPTGASVLTVGGADARLWDLRTATEKLSFSPHGVVASAGFSPDGKYVVTGSWDFSAKIWSTETGQAVTKLTGAHTGFVNSARFSPDGKHVLTASGDRTAKLWIASTGVVARTFAGHRDEVVHAAFSPDGTRVVTASRDATVRVWDARTAEELVRIEGHDWAVLSAEFSTDGNWIVTGSEDNTARLWELTDDGPEQRLVLSGHTAPVTSVALSPDRTRVITGSVDDTVKLWDAATGKEILTLDGHEEPVTAVAFSPDGRQALSAARDGRAIVWLAVEWEDAAAAAAEVAEGR